MLIATTVLLAAGCASPYKNGSDDCGEDGVCREGGDVWTFSDTDGGDDTRGGTSGGKDTAGEGRRDSGADWDIGPTEDAGSTTDAAPGSGDGATADAGDAGAGECRDFDCPGEQVCGEAGGCVEPSTELAWLQIKDMNDEDCDAADPGADLFAAELTDGQGGHLGWGELTADNLEGRQNRYVRSTEVLDGREPDFTAGSSRSNHCPASKDGSKFRHDSVVSLGCNGAVVVSFTAPDGETVPLERGQQVHVWEYGAQCCASNSCSPEPVQASICATDDALSDIVAAGTDDNGDFPTCDTGEVASGTGYWSATIPRLPEVE